MSAQDHGDRVLVDAFSFLYRFGFALTQDEGVTSKLLADRRKLTFSAKGGFRKIDVLYNPGSARFPQSVTISIADNRERSFLLRDFLKARGKEYLAADFVAPLDAPAGFDIIGAAAKAFEKICEIDLNPILTGPAWEDVPFDWKGYR